MNITREELRLSLAQADVLPSVDTVAARDMSIEHVTGLLRALGLANIGFGKQALEAIVATVVAPRNPYA
jgi:hypothetical protein